MQIICNLFYIILFVTVIGGAFTVLSLAAGRIMHLTLPLWSGVCEMAAYMVPLLAPGLSLVSPEAEVWIPEYYMICSVWFCGAVLLSICHGVRTMLARRAILNCRVCNRERIKMICDRCAGFVGIKKVPAVYFGTLGDPACAAGVLRPAVLLNEEVTERLTDQELTIVLCHELTHIRRRHILLERMYEYICILNWMNPLVWIAKKKFAAHCEIDCDNRALACLEHKLTNADYANTMIRLLELSAAQSGSKGCGISALGCFGAKRRIELIMRKPARAKKVMAALAAILFPVLIFLFSMSLSRGHFYPYPAYQGDPEYSCDYR